MPLLEALQFLNQHPDETFALSFNVRNNKWLVVKLTLADFEPYSAANTPEMALRDAITLSS